jgi:antitoxin component YwqK of YwqJK toxin-antitoxin module
MAARASLIEVRAMERIDIDDSEVSVDTSHRYTYRGVPYTGEAVEYGQSGRIVGLWTIKDGIEDGPQKSWNADGTIDSEGVSRYGMPVGEWRVWHPNGQLKSLDVFDEHGHHLSTTEWAEDGVEVEPPPGPHPRPPDR